MRPQSSSSSSASASASSSSSGLPMRPPKLPRRSGSTHHMPSLRRTHTYETQQSGTSDGDGMVTSPDAYSSGRPEPSEGAASVSLRSLQSRADLAVESAKLDLREIAIRRFQLERLNPPALSRLKMAHELIIRSCNMTLCATIFCTEQRLIVANETANRDKRSITEVEEKLLRALLEHVAEIDQDVIYLSNLSTFAEEHDCTEPLFQTFVASPVRIPPSASEAPIVVGMLAAFDVVQRDALSDEDAAYMRHLADAATFIVEDLFAADRRRGELVVQRAIVGLNRLLAGERVPDDNNTEGGPAGAAGRRPSSGTDDAKTNISLFANAARALCDALNAEAAVIIDVSSFRLRPGGRAQQSTSTLFGSDSDTASHDASASDEGLTTPGPVPPSFKREQSTMHGRLVEREPTRAILNTETSCFYGLSANPLPIVGASGEPAVLEHFAKLPGKTSRPCVARFLASRHLTRSYGETKAEGEFEAARSNLLSKPDSLVPLLPGQCKGLLAAPVYEFNRQPAFLVIATFKNPPYQWEEPDFLLVEQMGAVLLSAVHRARARAVDVAQTYFMRKVSHELRTPLHAILGVTEMTRLALPPQNEELISLVDSISLAADSLSNTIDDLVDFNALNGTILHGAGVKVTDSTMTATVLDIFGTISDAAVAQYTHRRRVLRQSDLAEIQKPINPDLPPPELFIKLSPISNAALKKVDIDVEALRRIVSKVVSNALRATETGIITVSAAISAVDADSPTPEMGPFRRKSRKKASELEIVISDTGKGMTDKFLKARLFEPFSQEDPFWSGTGLSLTLCRNMIDELGGRVQVSSVVGEGTDFFIHVPLPGGIAETHSERSMASPRSATPTYFLKFDDEERYGHRTYRSHLIRQFDLRPVEEAQVGQARVIFIISEALEDDSALAVLEGNLGRFKNKATTTDQGPLLVVLSAFGFKDDPEKAQSLVKLAEAEQCELLILERPFGVKGILLLDDNLRRIGDAEREGREALMQRAGMLVTGALDVNGRRSPNMRASAEFRVLVVEDNPLNARILTAMLRKIGVGFHEATNGREAVDMYRKYSHDVVLMDISMPEMDGFEACEKIKAMDGSEGSRIIAITALSSELDRIRGREVGFSEWIVKPVRLGPLAQDVKRWKEEAYASRILEWKANAEASRILEADLEMDVYI